MEATTEGRDEATTGSGTERGARPVEDVEARDAGGAGDAGGVAGEGGGADEGDAASWLFSGWRKAALFAVGVVALGIVGYRQQIGGKRMGLDEVRAAAIAAEPAPRGSATATGREGGPAIVGSASAVAARAVGVASAMDASDAADGASARSPESGRDGGGAAKGGAGEGQGDGAREVAQDGGAAGGKEAGAAPVAGIAPDGRVVLNLASEVELRKLPGIGKARAKAIVEQRERLGRFRRLEDLLRVKGIGPKRLAQLRAKIVLDPP